MKKLVNFRDIGGITTVNGYKVKSKRLLRSGAVSDISISDKRKLLEEYNLSLIVDFRDEGEILKQPDDNIEGVDYCNINIMQEIQETTTDPDSISDGFNSEMAKEGMKSIYKEIILDQTARRGYRHFIQMLTRQREGAVLFHCYAGKDRTGIGAAIILTILGVSEDDIFNDYMKTNEQRAAANLLILDEAKQNGYCNAQLEGLEKLMSVDASYLEEMYKTISECFGSFADYIADGLAIKQEEIELMKQIYLE